jgi:hypothetical protein
MYRRYRPLVHPQTRPTPAARVPAPRPFPSGRYARMNPLLRWFGLHLLAEPLPASLRPSLIHAWMHPGRFDGTQATQSLHRQRPPEDALPFLPPSRLNLAAQIELGVGRRIVETPRTEITSEERNRLLRSQGAYLAQVYAALVRQRGEATAHAEFERWLLAV